ncbi:hypothetical protein K7X08_010241 [Anisodus acutangulus]|uniref:Uncharacterized protein n=1 Tax=Anisodus acutangulus TaxID=402998 RepID=A0A9Q1N4T8_9SOLA|nr:hypothetical protein K7X08_010241 [Anisodus acutangulus]
MDVHFRFEFFPVHVDSPLICGALVLSWILDLGSIRFSASCTPILRTQLFSFSHPLLLFIKYLESIVGLVLFAVAKLEYLVLGISGGFVDEEGVSLGKLIGSIGFFGLVEEGRGGNCDI